MLRGSTETSGKSSMLQLSATKKSSSKFQFFHLVSQRINNWEERGKQRSELTRCREGGKKINLSICYVFLLHYRQTPDLSWASHTFPLDTCPARCLCSGLLSLPALLGAKGGELVTLEYCRRLLQPTVWLSKII